MSCAVSALLDLKQRFVQFFIYRICVQYIFVTDQTTFSESLVFDICWKYFLVATQEPITCRVAPARASHCITVYCPVLNSTLFPLYQISFKLSTQHGIQSKFLIFSLKQCFSLTVHKEKRNLDTENNSRNKFLNSHKSATKYCYRNKFGYCNKRYYCGYSHATEICQREKCTKNKLQLETPCRMLILQSISKM